MSHTAPRSRLPSPALARDDLKMKLVLATVLAMSAAASLPGCYAEEPYSYGYASYGEPPVATDVYYEPREGYVYVNGHYNWAGGRWAWEPGSYIAERPNQVFIQGYWNGGRWYGGRWEAGRPGYVHTGGYWEPRGNGHVWRSGSWERERENHSYVRGGWSRGANGQRSYRRGHFERRR